MNTTTVYNEHGRAEQIHLDNDDDHENNHETEEQRDKPTTAFIHSKMYNLFTNNNKRSK